MPIIKVLLHKEEGPGPNGDPMLRWTATSLDYGVMNATYSADPRFALRDLLRWFDGNKQQPRKVWVAGAGSTPMPNGNQPALTKPEAAAFSWTDQQPASVAHAGIPLGSWKLVTGAEAEVHFWASHDAAPAELQTRFQVAVSWSVWATAQKLDAALPFVDVEVRVEG